VTGDEPAALPAESRAELRQALEGARVRPDELEPALSFTVGDVKPQPHLEARHLWAQELVRASLAIILLVLLAGTVGWAFIGAGGANWANYKELLQLLLPAETALLGSAAGFYFGTRRD